MYVYALARLHEFSLLEGKTRLVVFRFRTNGLKACRPYVIVFKILEIESQSVVISMQVFPPTRHHLVSVFAVSFSVVCDNDLILLV